MNQKEAARLKKNAASAKHYALHAEERRTKRRERHKADPAKDRALCADWYRRNPRRNAVSRLKRLEEKAGRPRPDACEECRKIGPVCFDHDHETGVFRGWICDNCNFILGHAHDNPDLLVRLAKYLKRSGRR